MTSENLVTAPVGTTLKPVSYTHLDVYKRQVFISCCDPAPVMRQTGGCAFEVRDGSIIKSL